MKDLTEFGDPKTFLLEQPPGSASLAVVNRDGTKYVAMICHENHRETYGANVLMQPALLAETIDGVIVVAYVIRLDNRYNSTWETYININATDGYGFELLCLLAQQDKCVISLLDHYGERHIGCSNQSCPVAIPQIIKAYESLPKWTMKQFDDAKDQFQKRHSQNDMAVMLFGTVGTKAPATPKFKGGHQLKKDRNK